MAVVVGDCARTGPAQVRNATRESTVQTIVEYLDNRCSSKTRPWEGLEPATGECRIEAAAD